MSEDENFKINSAGVLTEHIGSGGDIVVPDGVTSIGENAFNKCESLTSITYKGVTYSSPDELYNAIQS